MNQPKCNALPLNMDFSEAVSVLADNQNWIASPAQGVSRVHLERTGPESGHTTSIVQFAPGASFPEHVHAKGEELYILEGVFSDERGDFPAGSYIRNPPGSRHSPFTVEGCTLFVKLEQFQVDDLQPVVVKPQDRCWQPGIGKLRVLPLHAHGAESTALVHWPKNEVFQLHTHWGGEEILVLDGRFIDEHGEYPRHSWIRNPHMSKHFPRVEEETLILVKVGHLA